MAVMATRSRVILGAHLGQDLVEGSPVVLVSGVLNRNDPDLPTVIMAPAGATDIYIVLAAPDAFPRPTPEPMFNRRPYTLGLENDQDYTNNETWNFHPRFAKDMVEDPPPQYYIGPSMLMDPVLKQGWLVQIHRGGCYTVGPNVFVNAPAIRIPGATVAVGTSGKFYQSTTNVVGTVIEYYNGRLTIEIK